jgi:hypothetical protein
VASTGVFRSIYRVRPLSAAILCLPGILLCLWYGWSAFAGFDRYSRAAGREVAFTAEEFHIQLFDILRRDLRRMLMAPPPDPSLLELFSFQLGSDNMSRLLGGAEQEAGRTYVRARLQRGATVQPLEIRLRGQRPWHLNARQKSLKIRLPKGSLLFGNRIFNLINDPSPMVVGDQVMLDILQEQGVLTPLAFFARVKLNGADLGVYHFQGQPEESLLRLSKRMPGSMYSGNLPPSADTKELWRDASRWKKVAWRGGERKDPPHDLKRLLAKINSATVAEFVDFARYEIDQRAFATFDAVDVAFGCDQHNFRENHKLYFDPYRGRWEPVAWNLQGFRDDPFFNLVENPILLRLKQVPGFVSLRNRILHDLLMGDCSVSSIRARATDALRKLAPELSTDPYWDAYHLLPRIGGFHRRMSRPMNLRRAALVLESELTTYQGRHAFLVRELQKNPLWIAAGTPVSENRTSVDIVIDGRSGAKLERFRARFAPECEQVQWRILRDDAPLTEMTTDDLAELREPLDLFPGTSIVEHENPGRSRGNVRVKMVPERYRFVIEASCVPREIEAEGTHLATGSRIRSRAAARELLAATPGKLLKSGEVPAMNPGERSAHPWSMRKLLPRSVQLGPGVVEIPETRVFGANERVTVAPGTRLRMTGGASLIFLGKATFEGTRQQPIFVKRAGSKPWGGIALQGPGTSGSTFEHVTMTGGSVPEWRLIPYPGMVNIHDTREIAIRNCRFRDNRKSDDVVHAAYVKDLLVEDSEVCGANADAWDLEFVQGVLRRVDVAIAGDDGLDLMGADIEIFDSVVTGCGGHGISAGEESSVVVRNSLVADAKVGVLAKNASRADLYRSLLFGNETGIHVYQRTVRYEGDSRVRADGLHVVGGKRAIRRDDLGRDRLDVGRFLGSLPRRGVLDHLLDNVLALEQWEEISALLKSRGKGGPR